MSACAIPVALSSASVYPESTAAAFEVAANLGFDGVEVMVWTDPVSQSADALRELIQIHQLPVVSIHAPTLLLTQRVWGTDPWGKIDKSVELAQSVGATSVVVHPPFRWQSTYANEFVEQIALREHESGIQLAVENMFPWKAGRTHVQAYLPHWDPVEQPFDHVTLDLSHTATAGSDALAMAHALGDRLTHLHLADGTGIGSKDEHLVPGRGTQPCAEVLSYLADRSFSGAVVLEVGTRKLDRQQREDDLGEALTFARRHLGGSEPR